MQPLVMNLALNISSKSRRRSDINKIILSKNMGLTKIPLVKYETIMPFVTNFYKAFIYGKIFQKFGEHYQRRLPFEFLYKIQNYVQDLANSSDVINCEYYDYKKIKKSIDEFYEGKQDNAMLINRWLSFDFWRRLTG